MFSWLCCASPVVRGQTKLAKLVMFTWPVLASKWNSVSCVCRWSGDLDCAMIPGYLDLRVQGSRRVLVNLTCRVRTGRRYERPKSTRLACAQCSAGAMLKRHRLAVRKPCYKTCTSVQATGCFANMFSKNFSSRKLLDIASTQRSVCPWARPVTQFEILWTQRLARVAFQVRKIQDHHHCG